MGYYNWANKQLENLLAENETHAYSGSPYVGMRLGMANNLINSQMPGTQQFRNNIFSSQGNSLNFIQKNATDASQALALAAGIGGQTDQALSDLQLKDAEWKKFGLNNLNEAYNEMTDEDRFKYNAEQQNFQNEVQLKGAQAANKLAKRKALWNTVGQIGQLAASAFTGGANSAAAGIGKMFSGGAASAGGAAGAGMASGGGAGGVAALLSDIRFKENYFVIGKSTSGINIYEFSYKGNSKRYVGVMAQEVPFASINVNGSLFVDYSKTDVEFKEI